MLAFQILVYSLGMTRVGVTGGAGFIGSNLVRRLLDLGHEVVVVDDLSTGLISNLNVSQVEFHHTSILDSDQLFSIFADCEKIFHFAARGSVPRSILNPLATHEVNATGTLNVLEVARKTNAHIIFSSSSSVYGRNLSIPKDEKMWLSPISPYAASKLSAESYMQAYSEAYGLKITILRFFNVFGPFQRPNHEYAAVIPKWIWAAIHDQPLIVNGDGLVSRDFTYIETVLDVAISAMEQNVITQGAVNVAFGNRIYLNQVLDVLSSIFPEVKVLYDSPRSGDVKDSQNSPALLTELFPKVEPRNFESALLETIDWFKTNRDQISNGF
jgi:UDP-glucose 4-epimerase